MCWPTARLTFVRSSAPRPPLRRLRLSNTPGETRACLGSIPGSCCILPLLPWCWCFAPVPFPPWRPRRRKRCCSSFRSVMTRSCSRSGAPVALPLPPPLAAAPSPGAQATATSFTPGDPRLCVLAVDQTPPGVSQRLLQVVGSEAASTAPTTAAAADSARGMATSTFSPSARPLASSARAAGGETALPPPATPPRQPAAATADAMAGTPPFSPSPATSGQGSTGTPKRAQPDAPLLSDPSARAKRAARGPPRSEGSQPSATAGQSTTPARRLRSHTTPVLETSSADDAATAESH